MLSKPTIMTKPSKVFMPGDIVYWHSQLNGRHDVGFGRVDEQIEGIVYIDLLSIVNRQTVSSAHFDAIPLTTFKSEERFHKLPKGWSYDTPLCTVDNGVFTDEERQELRALTKDQKDKIKELFEKGLLVKAEDADVGFVDEEITRDGYRIVKRWVSNIRRRPTRETLFADVVYSTYEEAKEEVDKVIQEFERQANLLEYEWSVEQIDKTIDRWRTVCGRTEREAAECRDYILALDDVENVETRFVDWSVEWKYVKNKRWNKVPSTYAGG